MTNVARWAVGAAVVLAALGLASRASATESGAAGDSQQPLMAADARVRGVGQRVAAVLIEGAAQSKTFRGLIDQIETTDGIVYIAEGQCGHGVRACLLHTMTAMGPNRMLRILVDPRKSDQELMGSIGHELQHVVEVLSHRNVRSYSAMILLYKEICDACGLRFETDAAIGAGNTVRAELLNRAAAERRECAARRRN